MNRVAKSQKKIQRLKQFMEDQQQYNMPTFSNILPNQQN